MDPRETGCETVDWIYMAQYKAQWQDFVNTVMDSGSIKGKEILRPAV
jgi:hypothetical protein